MKFTVLRIIFDVVVLYHPAECADWMRYEVPMEPVSREMVRLDRPTEGGGCIIRYKAKEIDLPEDWQGV